MGRILLFVIALFLGMGKGTLAQNSSVPVKNIQIVDDVGETFWVKANEVSSINESVQNGWGGVAVIVGGQQFFTSKSNLDSVYDAKPSLKKSKTMIAPKSEPVLVKPRKTHVLPGDTIAFDNEMFGYDVFSNGEVNFALPPDSRIKVIEDMGNGGYLIEVVKEWSVNGQRRVGLIRLLDEGGAVLASPTVQQFIIHPSDADMLEMSLVNRGGAAAVPEKNVLSQPNGNKHVRVDEDEPMGKHVMSITSGEVRAFPEQRRKMRVNDGAFMRAGPSQDFKVLGGLKKGAEVSVIESKDGWFRIANGSVEAWVHGDLLKDLDAVPVEAKPEPVLVKPNVPPPPKSSKNCLVFNESDYSNQKVQAFIRQQRLLDTKGKIGQKKQEFFNFFAPFAVHLAEISGYPASVIMAQWIGETEWGASNVLQKTNNIAGYSCFKEHESYKTETIKFAHSGKVVSYSYNCKHRRPKVEKGYYKGFKNIIEAGYAIVYNVVDKKGTRNSYGKIRAAINNKKLIPSEKTAVVLAGLDKYATDRNYISKISEHVYGNNLERYDVIGTCK